MPIRPCLLSRNMAADVASENVASLPYHEPGIQTILVLVSFLLLLNVINAALDKVLYCGLLGQVLIGIAWGTPGAKWLSTEVEEVIVQLGYLGLILLVYEGSLWLITLQTKANIARWPTHLLQILKGQPAPLIWSCSDWHLRPYRSVLYATRTPRCHPSASFRSRCCLVLHQLGDYVHRAGLQRPFDLSSRCSPHQCSYDG